MMKSIIILFFVGILLSSCATKYTVVTKDGKQACINMRGNEFIPLEYDYISSFSENRAVIKIGDKYGFINSNNETIVDPIYKKVTWFNEGLAAVAIDSSFGFINTNGELIIDYKFEYISWGFRSGLASFRLSNDSCGYINKKGEVEFYVHNATCYPFQNKYAQLTLYDVDNHFIKHVIINRKGEVAYDNNIPYKLRWIKYYPHIYEKGGKQGLLSAKGDTLTNAEYDVMASIIDGRMIYKVGDKWGVMTKTGKVIREPVFDEINHFFESYAKIKINDKWGFINKDGEVVIKPQFDKVGDFHYKIASVSINNKLCFINKDGDILFETEYDFNYQYFKKLD